MRFLSKKVWHVDHKQKLPISSVACIDFSFFFYFHAVSTIVHILSTKLRDVFFWQPTSTAKNKTKQTHNNSMEITLLLCNDI